MILYYASEKAGLQTLEPGEKTKLTDSKMIAAFCFIDPLKDPWHWLPCDFGGDGTVQYHELYQNAFKEACEGKKGFLYTVDADEKDLVPFGDIAEVCFPDKELKVKETAEIPDFYEWLMEEEDMGRFRLCAFDQKSRKELLLWQNSILRYLAKNRMIENPECSYAKFIREKLPEIWEKYKKLCGN